jgi:beta-glucosidase
MILAPVINLLRHPAWGRAQETYGEDSFLLGRLGSAFTAGVQQYIPACAKHYAAYDIENGRGSNNSLMDEQTLREDYARHFGVVIQDGGVACLMAAYNLVNGTKSTINKHLLTDILHGDFGFQGFVLSDWWAMPPGSAPATTDTLQSGAVYGVNAGLDMELPWAYNYGQLEAVTGSGTAPLSQAQLSTSATRILEQKYRFKVAALGSTSIGLQAPTTTLSSLGSIENNAAHVTLARRAALESMVLLKNDKKTLPISRTAVHTVAVIGAAVPYQVSNTAPAKGTVSFATDVRLGDLGSSRVFADPAKSTNPAQGIQAVAGTGIKIVSGTDASAAAGADFIVAVVGLTPQDEGEEYTGAGDRSTFALDGKSATKYQDPLVQQLAMLGKPMVVVIEGGSVVDMPWLSQVPAVVMAWYPGMDGGHALGELLFGDVNFGGKLPVTWPKQWSDEPTFNSGSSTQFGYYVGYKYFDQNSVVPLFPFGFGLSYTTFSYSNLAVPCSTATSNGVVYVTADVANTGTVAGDEVSFLFVSYPGTKARRPVKELKGFFRETLNPGETKRITFPLRVADLKYWDNTANAWQPPTGTVQIMVGGSSDNLPLKDTMTVQ